MPDAKVAKLFFGGKRVEQANLFPQLEKEQCFKKETPTNSKGSE